MENNGNYEFECSLYSDAAKNSNFIKGKFKMYTELGLYLVLIFCILKIIKNKLIACT